MGQYKVVSMQNVSSMCVICGEDSEFSLHAHFYNLENGDLYTTIEPLECHQSYPGRTHGGIAGAIIDECIGRTINSTPARATGQEDLIFGVTMDLKTRYRKPTPYGEQLYCVSHVMRETTRFMEGKAWLYSPDGTLCMEGWARYIRLSAEEIMDGPMGHEEWHPDSLPCPEFVEIPVYPNTEKK